MITSPGLAVAGPVFSMDRSTGGEVHDVPSLESAGGPGTDETSVNVGAADAGPAIRTW